MGKIWTRFGQDLGKIYATFSKKVFLLYVDQAIRGCGKKVCFSLRLIGICRLAHKKFLAAKYFLEIFMKNFLMSVQNFQNLEFLKSNIFKIWNFQNWVFPKSEISKIQYFSNSNIFKIEYSQNPEFQNLKIFIGRSKHNLGPFT